MPTLLQINCDANWGSTGRIVEQIGQLAMNRGWNSYIAYGRDMNPSKSNLIKVGSRIAVYKHYMEHRLFDNEGLASRNATEYFIKRIKDIDPDIIHLHNIHDHWINYKKLFDFLSSIDIPVVWTQHDCWAFTGGCAHFSMINCNKWLSVCTSCQRRRGLFRDNSKQQYNLKKQFFTKIKNLTLVAVSEWLTAEVKKSFLNKYEICTILNGVDVEIFKPCSKNKVRKKYNIGNGSIMLAAATAWSERKGFSDYLKLADLFKANEKLVLVGLNENQCRGLPKNIIAIPRTQDISELVALYNEASIVLNLSYEETFGLTTVEGFACGTPGIVYNCTASPELITSETGIVIEAGNVEEVYQAIQTLLGKGKDSMLSDCRTRAEKMYDKNRCFEKYIDLYNRLL